MKRIAVIGGGAAGMMAALSASKNDASVILLDKNEKTGKKLYITGKGRCNFTNVCDKDTFFESIVSNNKFLYGAYSVLDNEGVIFLLNEAGLKTKIERGGRVFPQSDKASDVIKALNALMKSAGVKVYLKSRVKDIEHRDNEFIIKYDADGKDKSIIADSVIVATGGLSYPQTGSTGDGLKLLSKFGHTYIKPKPALVPFNILEGDAALLQGLSLKNVSVMLKKDKADKKDVFSGFGEMLFTHFGVSGPLILSASSYYAKKCDEKKAYLYIDLKPALTFDELDKRLLRDFEENKNKQLKNSLNKLLPSAIIPVIIKRSGIGGEKRVNELTKKDRETLIKCIKEFTFTVTGTRGFEEAIITQGGISVKEINPKTMESKLIKGLYIAGEIMDVDALTGGFNLQIAWSTGYLAGISAANETEA